MKLKYLKKDEIISELRTHLETFGKYKIKKIGLFGSYLRENQKKDSDIDILIEFDENAFDKNFTGYFENYLALKELLEEIFGRKIDLITVEMISPYIKPYILKEVEYV
ncbi:MAG TPA: nucleotidyltransferase family protein [Candidatus Deferrimicrobium sp.]|nr:nucleotidyltransferase family protein [Candidatus Deferrimicrobium sp.]